MSKALVIGIVVVVVGIFILGGILLLQMQPSPPPAQPTVQQTPPPPPPAPSPQPQAEVLDTSDWQTYRNEEYGFALDHPVGWTEQGIENLIVFNDKQGRPFMSLTFTDRAALEYFFCAEAGNIEEERCERIIAVFGAFVIDWQADGGPTAATDLGIAIFITLNQENEELFKQILSTFRFSTLFDR